MSQLFVDDVVSKEGTNSVGFSKGISVSVASTFSGNVSIAGTLTYEDVTSVDVVGLITARGGIKLGAAGIGGTFNANGDTTLAGVVTATSFVGNLTGDVTGTASNASGATGDFSIADKIIHTGDTNTALRFPAADTITAETGGVERLRITSAGNIGIGENDPSTKLSLESADGSISNGILIGAKNASGIRGVVEVHSAADTIGFNLSRTGGGSDTDLVLLRNVSSAGVIEARNASNASKVYLNSNGSSYLNGGNIGINTVTPQQMLDVRGSAVIGIDQRSGNPGTTVGILTVRGHHVNSDSDYAQLYLSNSLSSGTASASIRAGRSGDNYGTTLSFYNNPTGGVAETERMRITAAGVVEVAGITSTKQLTVGPGLIQEKLYNVASALTGTVNFDVVTNGLVQYHTTNSSATFIANLRGDGSTTFNSLMHIGQTSVFTLYSAQNNASYYLTDFKIDGASQTEKWNGGSAPTGGTASGVDVYTFNIMKTADATFTVFATFSNFA